MCLDVTHDSDQKGISSFNQYFKPNCFNFIAFQIISIEIVYTFFTAMPPPVLILSFLSNVYPLIWRNEFDVEGNNRVSVIPKILIFF